MCLICVCFFLICVIFKTFDITFIREDFLMDIVNIQQKNPTFSFKLWLELHLFYIHELFPD